MEFVSNLEDMLKVVGPVRPLFNRRGIEMSLPEEMVSSDEPISIHTIVYGENTNGKRYIETVSLKHSSWPVYGEASIPEILVFAEKAKQELPESPYTKELYTLACHLKTALDLD